jgi:O-antigen biosynthesis protein
VKVNRPDLKKIFAEHTGKVSDKWTLYVSEYERHFQMYRDRPVRLLEIGIQNGGSLEVWAKYFSRAKKLVGCDIDAKCFSLRFENKKIAVVVGDANCDEIEQRILAKSASFDLIVDDGSHRSSDIVRSFARYFKHLSDDGLYVAEDLHCSYWQQFEGGIFHPFSSISFFKRLADVVNHQHWGVGKARIQLLKTFNREYDTSFDENTLSRVHSIEFVNSMCIVKKSPPPDNSLGARIVIGTIAQVESAPIGLHGTPCPEFDQGANNWATRELSIEEELAPLNAKVESLDETLAKRDAENLSLRNSAVESESSHENKVALLQSQIEQHLSVLAEREATFSAQLQQIYTAHSQANLEQIEQSHRREEMLKAQLAQAEREANHQLQALAAREMAFSTQLQHIHLAHTQERLEIARRNMSKEEALKARLARGWQLAQSSQQQLEKNERAFSAQLQQAKSKHAQEIEKLIQQNLATEEMLNARLTEATQQSQGYQQKLAEREIAFSEQLQEFQLTHARGMSEQFNRYETRTQEFARNLAANQSELARRNIEWQEMEQKQKAILVSVLNELKDVYESRIWQWTSPFRKVGPALLGAHHWYSQTVSTLGSVGGQAATMALAGPIEGKQTELSANLIENNRVFDMVAGQSPTAARSLNELLTFWGEEFVRVAYITILGREADEAGLRHYLSSLYSGASKFEIVTRLFSSEEAKSKGLTLDGLDEAMRTSELYELMCHFDESFVRKAYIAVLGRDIDADGLQNYLSRIREGEERIEILAELRGSEEGQAKSLDIRGLDVAIKKHLSRKTSLRRSILGWGNMTESLAHAQRNIRVLENRMYALDLEWGQKWIQHLGNEIAGPKSLALAERKSTRNKGFDEQWYVSQNPEVASSGLTPLEHYQRHGKQQGLHPFFDEDWYLLEYPDVATSGLDPREHYERYGKLEGRHPRFDRDWYVTRYPDVAASGIEPLEHYLRHGKAEGRFPAFSEFSPDGNNYSKWIRDFDTITALDREVMASTLERFVEMPLISIIMPVYNPNAHWLREAIDSVRNQIYPKWELCIADDASPNPEIRSILREYALIDTRIKVDYRKDNGHISAASNSALAIASGQWVALLDHDDTLPEHALFWVVHTINSNSEIRLIYSDEDKINEVSQRFGPYFKCDWNPDLFYSHNMFSHLGVYQMGLVREVGGFRIGFEGSQDYDLALRCIERVKPDQIHHIPRVLYHWRMHAESTASSADAKPYAMIAGERAINDHLSRLGVNAKVDLQAFGYRVRHALPAKPPLVSLIIPTRNGLDLLQRCVESIVRKTTYTNYEILIVDNGSDEPATLKYLKSISSKPNISVIRDDRPFNYSALNNGAVRFANGEVIGLVNNDIEVISPDWLSELVSHALRPEVGAVGAKLLFPDDTIQHAGILLGITGIAAHAHKGFPRNAHGYFSRANLIQSFSAVTGACLVVRKSVYELVGGLNEVDLAVAFNDVDFCMRLTEAGYRNIWTPYAELYHHESATRGYEDSPEKAARFKKEVEYMEKRLAKREDPAYSPNLTSTGSDFSLAWPPRIKPLPRNESEHSTEVNLNKRGNDLRKKWTH